MVGLLFRKSLIRAARARAALATLRAWMAGLAEGRECDGLELANMKPATARMPAATAAVITLIILNISYLPLFLAAGVPLRFDGLSAITGVLADARFPQFHA
jgi:hypothetical protein